jgi:uncharacterized protein HemX
MTSPFHWLGGLAVVAAVLIAMTVVIALAAKLMDWIEDQYEEVQYRLRVKRQEQEKRELIRQRHAAIRAYYHD